MMNAKRQKREKLLFQARAVRPFQKYTTFKKSYSQILITIFFGLKNTDMSTLVRTLIVMWEYGIRVDASVKKNCQKNEIGLWEHDFLNIAYIWDILRAARKKKVTHSPFLCQKDHLLNHLLITGQNPSKWGGDAMSKIYHKVEQGSLSCPPYRSWWFPWIAL